MQSSIVHKLLAVLTVISEAQKPMTFSEIVDKTGLNKSTIHRLLAIGVEEGVLRHDGHKKTYLLGSRVFDLVRNAYNGYDIQEIALDEMVHLHGLYDVNVTIAVPGGHEVVYLRVLESPHSLGGLQRPGRREPIHCSASGKALTAFLPEKALDALLATYEFQLLTERSIPDAESFKLELAKVRASGCGINNREDYDHFMGISSPIFNYAGEPIAALNLWSVYPRHTTDDLEFWSHELKASAARVTDMIGGMTPA